MSYKTLELSRRGPILEIGMNRPDVRNAFNEILISELHQVFQKEASDPQVRLIVLSGRGKAFCAGGDLNWMKAAADFTFEENLADTTRLTEMFRTLYEFPKPVIGSVHGAAIGGGVGLVSVCDYVIASEQTVFSLSEVRLGLIPACIGPFVISKIGASHARALFVSAERFSAKRAHEIGLVHDVVSESERENRVVALTQGMLECGPGAMAAAKQLVLELSWPEKRKALKSPYDYASRLLAELRVAEEGQEGVRAFLEKRSPAWSVKK